MYLMLLCTYQLPLGIVCSTPSIYNGNVNPAEPTVDYGMSYEVTCDAGFSNYRSATMTCGVDRNFDQTPECGKRSMLINNQLSNQHTKTPSPTV